MKNKNQELLYKATPNRPFHLSVRAVVLDSRNNVVCINYPNIDAIENVYSLMTETVKSNETPKETVTRGAREELGYEVNPIAFIGSTSVVDHWWGEINQEKEVEKSILYFVAKITSKQNTPTNPDSISKGLKVVKKSLNELIDIMRKQQVKDGMRDFNQLEILERARKWLTATL